MPWIKTETLKLGEQTPAQNHQIYNGLDCCLTLEIWEELDRTYGTKVVQPIENSPPHTGIYRFERALQGPYMDMMQKGFLVDEQGRRDAAQLLKKRITRLEYQLNRYAIVVSGKTLNPRSQKQLQEFFYTHLGLPEIWISQKGVKKLSVNREVLEKLSSYLFARPFVNIILLVRDLAKQLEVFEKEIDDDQRFRAGYNIAGTECISGDSLVWNKSGLRTIKEIYETPHSCAIWNGQKYATPVKKVKYANRAGFKITLENGYELKCSENHPLLTSSGFIEAKNLKSWNRIQMNVGLDAPYGQSTLPRGGLIEQSSENLAEFLGMMLADGSLNCNSEHYRLRLSNSSEEVRKNFAYLAKKLFNAECGWYDGEISFSFKRAAAWFKEIGFPADSGLGTACIKTIPVMFLRGTPNLLRALLRGLTLDTHITEKGLMFGTQSPIMRDQIQQILLLLGIVSVKLQTGNSIKLNVPRRYCGRFLYLIGFVQEDKMMQLCKMLNKRSQVHETMSFGQKYFFKIASIEPWTGDVYDLTMPKDSPPQYVAQGMTVHNTGRPSSSSNAFGTASNAQNIAPPLRYVFQSDPGWKMCVIDLAQVEARDVGFACGCLFNEWTFLDNCEGFDLHTANAKLIWRELPWPNNPKGDREVADGIFYRDFTFRDFAKRASHLSNYYGTAWTAARVLKTPIEVLEEFQARYIRGRPAGRKGPEIVPAFPEIARWWAWTASELQLRGKLTTPFGRTRHFFGRPDDDATLREAIAFLPQSTTADRMNLALLRIWETLREVRILAQTYDSVTFQYPETIDEDALIALALEMVEVPLWAPNNGRKYTVPGEAKIGWNWGNYADDRDISRALAARKKPPRLNLDGLKKWSPKERDERKRGYVPLYLPLS